MSKINDMQVFATFTKYVENLKSKYPQIDIKIADERGYYSGHCYKLMVGPGHSKTMDLFKYEETELSASVFLSCMYKDPTMKVIERGINKMNSVVADYNSRHAKALAVLKDGAVLNF